MERKIKNVNEVRVFLNENIEMFNKKTGNEIPLFEKDINLNGRFRKKLLVIDFILKKILKKQYYHMTCKYLNHFLKTQQMKNLNTY